MNIEEILKAGYKKGKDAAHTQGYKGATPDNFANEYEKEYSGDVAEPVAG